MGNGGKRFELNCYKKDKRQARKDVVTGTHQERRKESEA